MNSHFVGAITGTAPSLQDWHAPPAVVPSRIQGRLCRLEPLHPIKHAEALHAANRVDVEGHIWHYLPSGPFHTVDAYRAWLESRMLPDHVNYVVIPAGSDEPTGLVGYNFMQPSWGSLEIGLIMFAPSLQGTAAATESIFLLLEHAFTLGYRRCQWRTDSTNAASCASARRFGFAFEGIFRQRLVIKGRNSDTAWYSIVDHEWPALRAAFTQWLSPDNFDADGRQKSRLSDLTRPLVHDVVELCRHRDLE